MGKLLELRDRAATALLTQSHRLMEQSHEQRGRAVAVDSMTTGKRSGRLRAVYPAFETMNNSVDAIIYTIAARTVASPEMRKTLPKLKEIFNLRRKNPQTA